LPAWALLPLDHTLRCFLLWPIFESISAIAWRRGGFLLLIRCSSAVAFIVPNDFFPHPSVENTGCH